MKITEEKIISIKENGYNYIFTVPLDFDVTDQYIDSKLSNYDLTKCEEWLKSNGFIEEFSGWSYYGNMDGNSCNKDIVVPGFFVNSEKSNILVNFHRIENAKSFKFPFNAYNTLNNLPNYINKDVKLYIANNSNESKFYRNFSMSGLGLLDNNYTIDDYLLRYFVKNDCKFKGYDLNRFNLDIIKSNKSAYNRLKSLKTINKYKL